MPLLKSRRSASKNGQSLRNDRATEVTTGAAEARYVDASPRQYDSEILPISTVDARAMYDVYRRQIVHEENLLSQRATQVLVFQSFLVIAYGVLHLLTTSSPLVQPVTGLLMHLIVWLGASIALLILVSVCAASKVMNDLRIRFHWVLRHDSHMEAALATLPPLQPAGLQLFMVRAPNIVLPSLFLLFWTTLIVANIAAD